MTLLPTLLSTIGTGQVESVLIFQSIFQLFSKYLEVLDETVDENSSDRPLRSLFIKKTTGLPIRFYVKPFQVQHTTVTECLPGQSHRLYI